MAICAGVWSSSDARRLLVPFHAARPATPATLGGTVKVRLVKSVGFEAAHRLPRVPADHKCSRMHGHSFKVELAVVGAVDPEAGWLIDYAEIAAAWKPLHDRLDHNCLNDIEGLENPTSEIIAGWIWERLKPTLAGLERVIVHETCQSRCEYEGD